jgi:hypothetical protein
VLVLEVTVTLLPRLDVNDPQPLARLVAVDRVRLA